MMRPILPEASTTTLPPALRHAPPPEPAALAHMERLQARLIAEIDASGFMPFARFMELALYAPGLGYYASGATKLGPGGDYVTAPELSALFGASLAEQVAECLTEGRDTIVELGAGTGRMAADILNELGRRDRLPRRYSIIEISPDLAARQRETLHAIAPAYLERVQWLDRMPEEIRGVVLGNEVLDALPVSLVTARASEILELGVDWIPSLRQFVWTSRPAEGELEQVARSLALPTDYTTEVHLAAEGLVRSIGEALVDGVALFLDYGFPRREYYHPQRSSGTLMCHYRHHSHPDPLVLVGLQDITCHLDFTALAEAAHDAGLETLGFATQAHFLINCGILDRLSTYQAKDAATYARACAGVQPLLSPAEMGELFKVIAFGRNVDERLLGFRSGDRSARL